MKWRKYGWMVPAIIIIVNVFVIWIGWNSRPNMRNTRLIVYPVISLMLCLATYGIYTLAENIFHLRPYERGLRICGLHVFASCLTLTVLSSTLVTLTRGVCPLFMVAEPILLLAGIITLIVCLVKAKDPNGTIGV